MADPVIAFYNSTDTTELDDNNPEDYGNVITDNSSDPVIVHIWNDKGEVAGSTTMYNVRLKVVTATGLDSGDTLANGKEVVEDSWIGIKSLTNEDVSYTTLGNGVVMDLGDIAADSYHEIECIANVPADATTAPTLVDGDITFELQVYYDLTA